MKLSEKLTKLENKFGGLASNVFSVYTSEDLKRADTAQRMSQICQGGDRFSNGGIYNEIYARNIENLVDKKVNIFEIGILKGSGIAVWNEIFSHKDSKIIACDIDIDNFLRNFSKIKDRGGFKDIKEVNLKKENASSSRVSCFKLDQYDTNNELLIKEIIKEEKINIVIDDGDHQDKPNILTARAFKNYLDKDSVYILEDVKPARVKFIVDEFNKIGYRLVDNTNYRDGRVGGVLVFKINEE